jgi:hypothetical protein
MAPSDGSVLVVKLWALLLFEAGIPSNPGQPRCDIKRSHYVFGTWPKKTQLLA